jgi:hypothetical protein
MYLIYVKKNEGSIYRFQNMCNNLIVTVFYSSRINSIILINIYS